MTRAIEISSPSTAERVRSAGARSREAMLALPGRDPVATAMHHLRTCGDVVLAVPSEAAPTIENFSPAVLEFTDHAPLPLREPVRSLVWLRGQVHAVPAGAQRALASEVASENSDPALLDVGHGSTLMRLVLDSAVVADSSGADAVQVAELRAAQPDPFWEMEGAWLEHLEADHGDVIDALARRLPPSCRTGLVRPLGIDRYGITLRVEGDDADRDVRLPFPEPVDDISALSRAIRILVGCPFLNGMRRR